MEQSTVARQFVTTLALLACAAFFAGCEQPPEQQPPYVTSPETGASEGEPAVALEPKAEPEPDQPGPKIEPEVVTELEPSPESKPQPEPEAGPVLFPPTEPKSEGQGEPADESQPEPEGETEPQPKPELQPDQPPIEPAMPDANEPPDLGPPLVEDPKSLIQPDKTRPVWFDKANKRVVIMGQICQREASLELFACLRNTKEHEAIVSVDVEAATVHAGLLAVGAKKGRPARWDPQYVPATGTEIDVSVAWKDKQGKRKTARAQDWILDTQTNKAMEHPWVFAGSRFWEEEETGKKYYLAEGGDLICVSNFPSAMLDLPIESSEANDALMFRAFTERIPPLGTPVTLLLTPKLPKKEEAKPKSTEQGAEKKAD